MSNKETTKNINEEIVKDFKSLTQEEKDMLIEQICKDNQIHQRL